MSVWHQISWEGNPGRGHENISPAIFVKPQASRGWGTRLGGRELRRCCVELPVGTDRRSGLVVIARTVVVELYVRDDEGGAPVVRFSSINAPGPIRVLSSRRCICVGYIDVAVFG